jgi:hypothetical protein
MPSRLHESYLLLIRNRPMLAAELLGGALPPYTQARTDAADLTQIQPTEYRADMVVILTRDAPVLGIVIEVQLSIDDRKRFAWPVYVATLRARLQCPVCLLVLTDSERVARWAAKPIDLGGGNRFAARVVGPHGVPEITDEALARADPELAVLSTMAHGKSRNIHKSVQIACAAQRAVVSLDEERREMYFDVILASLSEAAKREFREMHPMDPGYKYEYQSDFAIRYYTQGQADGRAQVILRILTTRFGSLSDDIEARIKGTSISELDAMSERLLTASTLQEVIDVR